MRYRPEDAARWDMLFQDLILEVFAKYPDAEKHDPCPCGITLAVIPRRYVDPVLHFEVPDLDLKKRVLQFLAEHHRPESQHQGEDGVLVLTEIA